MSPVKEGIKILIADDDENTRRLLSEYITGIGGRVNIADDGKRALQLLDSKDYDFVFLDCNMPEITGVELAEYLKKKKIRPKIVMMTGYGSIDEGFAKAAGVDIYLSKPFLLGEVKKIIEGKI